MSLFLATVLFLVAMASLVAGIALAHWAKRKGNIVNKVSDTVTSDAAKASAAIEAAKAAASRRASLSPTLKQ